MKQQKLYVISGGCGFIGSQYVKFLNSKGIDNILIFDHITPEKLKNINECRIVNYYNCSNVYDIIDRLHGVLESKECKPSDIVMVHLGATSSTTFTDKSIIENNTRFSEELIKYCSENNIPIIYASSGSVYGHLTDGSLQPLCLYAYSKSLIDNFAERLIRENPQSLIAGLRFMNVYAEGEAHKKGQASVIYNWAQKLKNANYLEVFEGENKRDFVHVLDICQVIHYFAEHSHVQKYSGIYDVGTGVARDFMDIANMFKEKFSCVIKRIPIPDSLKDQYQEHTQANLEPLNNIGYRKRFIPLEEGFQKYVEKLW